MRRITEEKASSLPEGSIYWVVWDAGYALYVALPDGERWCCYTQGTGFQPKEEAHIYGGDRRSGCRWGPWNRYYLAEGDEAKLLLVQIKMQANPLGSLPE